MIDSALGHIPVIGDQLSSGVQPLEGSSVALVIGIVGTLFGSLGVGFAAQNAMNTVWNIPYLRRPTFWPGYLRTFGVIGLLGLSVLASTALAAFTTAVAHGDESSIVAITASLVVNSWVFLLAFMVLTAEPLRPREVAIGANIATVFWEILQLIGTWHISRGLRSASPTTASSPWSLPCCHGFTSARNSRCGRPRSTSYTVTTHGPRSLTQPPLTSADRLVFRRLAQLQVRRPEETVTASFSKQADEDPLQGVP